MASPTPDVHSPRARRASTDFSGTAGYPGLSSLPSVLQVRASRDTLAAPTCWEWRAIHVVVRGYRTCHLWKKKYNNNNIIIIINNIINTNKQTNLIARTNGPAREQSDDRLELGKVLASKRVSAWWDVNATQTQTQCNYQEVTELTIALPRVSQGESLCSVHLGQLEWWSRGSYRKKVFILRLNVIIKRYNK